MPYTTAGVYYPDGATAMSLVDMTQKVAESIDNKLGVTQVVYSSTSAVITNTSSVSYGNSGLSATITPKSASNKIIVLVHLPFQTKTTLAYWSGADFIVKRGSTQIITSSPGMYNVNDDPNGGDVLFSSALSLSYVDAPAVTTALTYTVQGKMWNTTSSATQTLSMNYSDGPAQSTLMLLEVAS